MPGYWVVVNQPTAVESHAWTTKDAMEMILGNYDGEPPRWSFNPSGSGKPPREFDKIREGDRILLYNGLNASSPRQAFLAYATAQQTSKVRDDYRILFAEPLGPLTPVDLTQLQESRDRIVNAAEFAGLFRGYRHGPLDNLAAHPGPASLHPTRGALRWNVIFDVGTGRLML
jgi:hypothetical protein